MHRWSFHFPRNADTDCWCDCNTILYLFYVTLNEIINLKRDEKCSKILTNENINGEGRLNLRSIREAGDFTLKITPKKRRNRQTQLMKMKKYKRFDKTNAERILQGPGQNFKEMKTEKKNAEFMETLRTTEYGREDIVVVKGNLIYMIRAEYLITVWMAKVQEKHTFVMIQRMIVQIHIDCLIYIKVWSAKVHGDVMVKGTFVYIRTECLMTTWQRGYIHSMVQLVHTQTEIQTTILKTKSHEETNGKVQRRHNEEKGAQFNGGCQHFGNEEDGELGNSDQKNPSKHFSKGTIKRRQKGVASRRKTTKRYGMLLHVLNEIFSLGKSLSMMQNAVICICICFILPAAGLNEACSASISSMKTVNECPKSAKDAHKRACEMNCHKKPQNCTPPDNFQYHCLKHAETGEHVDVCAPVKLISCHCAIYDHIAGMPQIDIENRYQGTLENCTYISNIFNDKGCQGIFETFNSTVKSKIILMTCPENFENNKTLNTFVDSTDGNKNIDIAVIVVGVVAFIVVVITTVFVICCVLRKRARERRVRVIDGEGYLLRDMNQQWNGQPGEN